MQHYLFNFTEMNAMVSLISEGVEVTVESFYQQDYSNPMHSSHFSSEVATAYILIFFTRG